MQRDRKILHIIGARPQFIKCGLLVNYLNNYKNLIIHTNQHFDFDMSDIFFKELKIKKPIILKNLKNIKNRSSRIGMMIINIADKLNRIKPNLAVIYGDTDTTLAASIVLRKYNVKTIHIEAGLRSKNLNMAEEQNRIVADHLCEYLITPNRSSTFNLVSEGVDKKKIYEFGDLLLDQAKAAKKIVSNIKFSKKKNFGNFDALMTMHRDENLDVVRIKKIFKEISKVNYKFIWPLHPKMIKVIKKLRKFLPKNITLIKPISYLETISTIAKSKFVLTDSGGVQREAYFLNKVSFILRDRSEWTELEKNNYSFIIDTNVSAINKKKLIFQRKNKKIFSNSKFKSKITNLIKKIIK